MIRKLNNKLHNKTLHQERNAACKTNYQEITPTSFNKINNKSCINKKNKHSQRKCTIIKEKSLTSRGKITKIKGIDLHLLGITHNMHHQEGNLLTSYIISRIILQFIQKYYYNIVL